MQSLRSRIRDGTLFSCMQAATARPDGPAPTIMGPGIIWALEEFISEEESGFLFGKGEKEKLCLLERGKRTALFWNRGMEA